MKRFALFALPIVAAFLLVATGLLLFRFTSLGSRIRTSAIRETVAEAIDEVTAKVEEALE
jgi:hypothetical protein